MFSGVFDSDALAGKSDSDTKASDGNSVSDGMAAESDAVRGGGEVVGNGGGGELDRDGVDDERF